MVRQDHSRGRQPRAFYISGQLDVPPKQKLLVATDAAAIPNVAAAGYVTTQGRYGMVAHPHPSGKVGAEAVCVAELRAVFRGLQGAAGELVIVLCDSQSAIDYMTQWKRGSDAFPSGYTMNRSAGKTPSLVKLAQRLRKDPDRYDVRWIKGHSQHPLNEVADSMAKLALRQLRTPFMERESLKNLAGLWAGRALEAYFAEGYFAQDIAAKP